MPQTFSDVACTVCGCVCDDLQVTVDDGCITQVSGACHLAKPWFAALAKPLIRPAAAVDGKPVSLPQAIERAAEILRSSRAPLMWGLTRSSTVGQRAAIALAEQLGGTVDTTASCHPAVTLAFQNVGQSTCSLGEVRNRADLVVFWGVDPVTTHTRHLERYSVDPIGEFLPRGRADRTVVVIDSSATPTSELADTFIQISPDSDLEIANLLRKVVGDGKHLATDDAVLPAEQLQKLAQQMKSCQYGAIFFGAGQSDRAVIEALLQLTTELNKFTRFTAHYLPKSGAPTGAENVLCWQTGFPFAVNFALGYPRYNPTEFSANALLEAGQVDACVLVGSEGFAELSSVAQERLLQLPTIALDYPIVEPRLPATVQITTAIYGIHAAGTAYRMDGVPIPLRQLMSATYPTDDEVLSAIAGKLK